MTWGSRFDRGAAFAAALVVLGSATSGIARAAPPLSFATLEINNATGERLPRFEEYSEAALQELLGGLEGIEVVFASKVYETAMKERILVGELPGDPVKATKLATAVGASYLLTGSATRWSESGESEELGVELVVVDASRSDYAFRKLFTARGTKGKALGHRALLDEILGSAKAELSALIVELSSGSGGARGASGGERLHRLPFGAERVEALYRYAKRTLVPFSSSEARPLADAASGAPVAVARRTLNSPFHLVSFDEGTAAGAALYRVELVWYLSGVREQPAVRAEASAWSEAMIRAVVPGLVWDEATRAVLGLNDLETLTTAHLVRGGVRVTRALLPPDDPSELVFLFDAPDDPAAGPALP